MLTVPSIRALDRLAPARRPRGKAIGYHRWSNLLFLHWALPPELVRPLLPDGLFLDEWEGAAYVGLVPFSMSGVRPWWSPPVPGVSSFHETNVRTYVYDRHGNPGVWFFSLDASSSLAVRIARRRWSLPYHRATMAVRRNGARIVYSGRRDWPGTPGAGCEIEAYLGGAWNAAFGSLGPHASPGTLDHFLIERYILFARSADGRLWSGRVHHRTYPLRRVRVERIDESLLASNGMAPTEEPCHAAFCDGVDVDVFPLLPVEAE